MPFGGKLRKAYKKCCNEVGGTLEHEKDTGYLRIETPNSWNEDIKFFLWPVLYTVRKKKTFFMFPSFSGSIVQILRGWILLK